MDEKIITVDISKSKFLRANPQWKYNYGQKLKFEGVQLPSYYQVHFSNSVNGEAKTQIGDSTGVEIPPEYFIPGQSIFAWIYVTDEDSGVTLRQVEIPIHKKALVTDQEITPHEQTVIDETIAALNDTIEDIPNQIAASLTEAKDSGIFDGKDGSTIWISELAPVAPNYTFNISGLSGTPDSIVKQNDLILYDIGLYKIKSFNESTVLADFYVELKDLNALNKNGDEMFGNLNMGSHKIINVAAAQFNGDAVNFKQVKDIVSEETSSFRTAADQDVIDNQKISNPQQKPVGSVLTFDGTTWVANDSNLVKAYSMSATINGSLFNVTGGPTLEEIKENVVHEVTPIIYVGFVQESSGHTDIVDHACLILQDWKFEGLNLVDATFSNDSYSYRIYTLAGRLIKTLMPVLPPVAEDEIAAYTIRATYDASTDVYTVTSAPTLAELWEAKYSNDKTIVVTLDLNNGAEFAVSSDIQFGDVENDSPGYCCINLAPGDIGFYQLFGTSSAWQMRLVLFTDVTALNAPTTQGTAGQILSLDSNLAPVWTDPSGDDEILTVIFRSLNTASTVRWFIDKTFAEIYDALIHGIPVIGRGTPQGALFVTHYSAHEIVFTSKYTYGESARTPGTNVISYSEATLTDEDVLSVTVLNEITIPEAVTVDSTLSTSSENPVQNKVITEAIRPHDVANLTPNTGDYDLITPRQVATELNDGRNVTLHYYSDSNTHVGSTTLLWYSFQHVYGVIQDREYFVTGDCINGTWSIRPIRNNLVVQLSRDNNNVITADHSYNEISRSVAECWDFLDVYHLYSAVPVPAIPESHPASLVFARVEVGNGAVTIHKRTVNYLSQWTESSETINIPSLAGYATEQWVQNQGYLTQHQSLADYQTKSITDTGGYYTTDTVEGALQEIGAELAGINTLIGSGVIT